MIDDPFRNDSFIPPLVSINSNNFMLSRDDSFFDTKFTSTEFRLQFNKNFDNMLDFSLVIRNADDLINSLDSEKLRAKETYQKISNCLFDILAITNRKNIGKEDSLRALQYQQKLIDISDKLTAIIGELKAAIAKRISESLTIYRLI